MAETAPLAFQVLQYRFAAHLRDPQGQPAPAGIEERRLQIYRELFYNNIASFLASAFPVLRRLLPDEHWQSLVRDFYARHRCRTPHFHEIAVEFLSYLQDERGVMPGDPPFLQELAHYEWVELALSVAEDAEDDSVHREGDLLAQVPVLSPLAWPLTYAFPVHRIGPAFQPQTPPPQPTCLVVYRDAHDEVKFLEVNLLTARLLALLDAEPAPGQELLRHIAAELGQPDEDSVVAAGAELLEGLRARGIILGTREP